MFNKRPTPTIHGGDAEEPKKKRAKAVSSSSEVEYPEEESSQSGDDDSNDGEKMEGDGPCGTENQAKTVRPVGRVKESSTHQYRGKDGLFYKSYEEGRLADYFFQQDAL